MAATPEGAKLTELHKLLQIKLSSQSMAATKMLWSTLDPTKGAAAMDTWLKQQVALSGIFDGKSSNLAADYVKKFREVEGFPGGPIEAVSDFDPKWAEESMSYNGSNKVQALMDSGLGAKEAMARVAPTAMAAAQRLTLGGGRRVVDKSTLANPSSGGWRRVSDGHPCSFCAMLVSRGDAYRSERSAGEGRHWHKRCGCSVEEVFGDWTPNETEQRYLDEYNAARKELESEDRVPGAANILEKMRLNGKFNDSPLIAISPRSSSMPYELKPKQNSEFREKVSVLNLRDPRMDSWTKDAMQARRVSLEGKNVRVAVPPDVVTKILDDGRWKSAFENVELYNKPLGSAEYSSMMKSHQTQWGVPDLEPGKRPIYGYFSSKPDPSISFGYGRVHASLKPEIQQRSTVSWGDSLNNQTTPIRADRLSSASDEELMYAGSLDPLKSAQEELDFGGKRAKIKSPPSDAVDLSGSYGGKYTEAQIHGGLRVEDVAEWELDYRDPLPGRPLPFEEAQKLDLTAQALRARGYVVKEIRKND